MPPTYYRGCWHVVSRGFLVRYRLVSSLLIELYIPKYFFTHAASLHQGFPHCAIFPTAASRRSLGRVSVPVWPSALSGRLCIVALVSRYLSNQLMHRRSICMRDSCPLFQKEDASSLLIRYQLPFPEVLPLMQAGSLRVTHPFATHIRRYPFDLHVLGMPPAFILSQDQTLHLILTLFFFSLLSVLIVFQVSQEIDVISVSLVLVRLFFLSCQVFKDRPCLEALCLNAHSYYHE